MDRGGRSESGRDGADAAPDARSHRAPAVPAAGPPVLPARVAGTSVLPQSAARALVALAAAECTLRAAAGRPLARRPTRVPHAAFVNIAPHLLPAPRGPLGLPAARHSANDNAAPARSPRPARPSVLRQAVFLAILAAALAGAFYAGRLHAYQKVIVVPGPMSFSSAVT